MLKVIKRKCAGILKSVNNIEQKK